jgi:hypothetical protein
MELIMVILMLFLYQYFTYLKWAGILDEVFPVLKHDTMNTYGKVEV